MRKTLLSILVGAILLAIPMAAPANAATLQLNVTVRQICDNGGANCASLGPIGNSFFAAEVTKIYAQADIIVNFIMGAQIWNSAWLNGSTGIDTFTAGPLPGPGSTLYLANLLDSPGLYGNAWSPGGGAAIAMGPVMAFNGGIGRLDTIAHELGHNLGIGHPAVANYLMASGGIRNVPNSLGQICPDGPCYSLIPADQIAVMRSSNLLVPATIPEPATLLLLGTGLAAAGMRRRMKKRG